MTCGMQGLVKVVGRGRKVRIGPESVGDLVTVQAVARSKRQQLDQAARAPEPPLLVRDALCADPHRKLPQ
jgi:hypothetical protein